MLGAGRSGSLPRAHSPPLVLVGYHCDGHLLAFSGIRKALPPAPETKKVSGFCLHVKSLSSLLTQAFVF